jgi:hypothetical protein
MKEITFATGVESFSVNGVENAFSANLADGNFIKRLKETITKLEEMHKNLGNMKSAASDDPLDQMEEYDRKVRASIDELLGDGVSQKIFGNQSMLSFGAHKPVWCNFLVSLVEECNCRFTEEAKEFNPSLEEFVRKYTK